MEMGSVWVRWMLVRRKMKRFERCIGGDRRSVVHRLTFDTASGSLEGGGSHVHLSDIRKCVSWLGNRLTYYVLFPTYLAQT